MISPNLHVGADQANVAAMNKKPYRRDRILPRSLLRAALDAMNPAHSPEASRAYEFLLDLEHTSADIELVLTDEPGDHT